MGIVVLSFAVAGVMASFDYRFAAVDRPPDGVQRNALEALYLGTEMAREVGPHFAQEQMMHARILEQFIARMQERLPNSLSSALQDKYSPKSQLQPALDILAGSQSSDLSSSNVIQQAAGIIIKTANLWSGNGGPIRALKAQNPPQFESVVEESLTEFAHSAEAFKEDRTVGNAELACMKSRLATETLLAFWPEFTKNQRNSSVDDFTGQLKSLQAEMLQLSSRLPLNERSRVERYANNVNSRFVFLVGMNNGELRAARDSLLAIASRH